MCLAVPGKLTAIYERDSLPMARIDFGGVVREICLACTPEARVGDYALVHVGFAIALMDDVEAMERLKLIKEVLDAGHETY